jgi:hypothetical protein
VSMCLVSNALLIIFLIFYRIHKNLEIYVMSVYSIGREVRK